MVASFILTSCGGGSGSQKEKITLLDPPKNLMYESVTLIDGPLSEYVEIVPGNYQFEIEKCQTDYMISYNGKMKIKLRFLKSIDVKAGIGYNAYGPCLNGKALDVQGAPLDFDLSVSCDKDLATYLKRGSGEEWLSLTLSGQGLIETQNEVENMIENFKKGKKIRLNSEIVEEEFEGSNSSNSSEVNDKNKNSSSSNANCDAVLKGYEEFMTDYIVLIKKYKANSKDPSIISDYTSMAVKAQDWASKTKDCTADPKFAEKIMQIQMKLTSALSEQ